jgi:hypothetical protein
VAHEFGISRERVRQILKREGIDSLRHAVEPRVLTCDICGAGYVEGGYTKHARAARHVIGKGSARRRGASDRTRAMATEYAQGGDAREIASRYGVTRGTVYSAGITVFGPQRYRRGTGPRTPRRLKAVSLLRAGYPNWLVMERTGLDAGDVCHIRARYIERKAVPA